MNLSGHQSARMKSDTYLTPPEWIEKLGAFDLDPCCPPNMPWATAKNMLSLPTDGLAEPWHGRVWLNPPFGNQPRKWLTKLAEHGNGIALIPARTETATYYGEVWRKADAICFVKGRPHFYYQDGTRCPFNSGAPITLIAYGERNVFALRLSGLGIVVSGWRCDPLWLAFAKDAA